MTILAADLMKDVLGLEEPWKVVKVLSNTESGDHAIHVTLAIPPLSKIPCPTCGRACNCYDHSEERTWRNTDVGSVLMFLHARIPRVQCESCHKTQNAEVPWARPGSRYTLVFETFILALAMEEPMSTVAKQARVNYRMVAKVVRRYAEQIRSHADLSSVTRVGVDERSVFKGHTYITIFVNLDNNKLIFATAGKDINTLAEFAEYLRKHNSNPRRITEFSCDFGQAFISGIRKYFRKASIVGDRFHLAKMANEALADVKFSTKGLEISHQRAKYILARKSSDLRGKQKQWAQEILEANPNTALAYRLRDSLMEVYLMGDRETAKLHLQSWVTATAFSRLGPFKRLSRTVRNHFEMILNWYNRSTTNASLEGTNNLLNKVKSRCYGFHKVESFIDLAYLVASNSRIDLYGKPRMS